MYKKSVLLSLLAAHLLLAQETKLEDILVEGSINSISVTDISSEEIKSADLAEALTKNVPSISLVRRSGIANDIILRGQKKDNINVLVDDAKIYGACPNRMDPSTSHVLSNNVDNVVVVEGPFDVENFGTLSGLVKINTKKPTKEIQGDINANFGSFGYMKGSATVSGGTDKVRVLLSSSYEKSGQYLDGNGDDFQAQILRTAPTSAYQDNYKSMDAYSKYTFMGKLFYDITNDQELKLGYTLNRSQNILYPSSKMDALYDNSDLINASYILKNLGSASKKLSFDYFFSYVDHPMSNEYRLGWDADTNATTNALTTTTQGLKIKNLSNIGKNSELTIGVDASIRNWDGDYYTGTTIGIKSIDDVNTVNTGGFAKIANKYENMDLDMGLRYDYTTITPSSAQQTNTYQSLTANIFSTLHTANKMDYFVGLGRSSRIPDARELYFIQKMGAQEVGTPSLSQTFNNEIDLGFEKSFQSSTIKGKIFYSFMQDYIVYKNITTANRFENIDASIYGVSLSGTYNFNDNFYTNYGLAYQRGQKNQALTAQTDLDLAEIPPLKLNLAFIVEPDHTSKAKIEVIAADGWRDYDADNGEQEIQAYAIVNLKYSKTFAKKYGITVGVDNVLNHTYAVSNTYSDLTLLTDGTNPMLLNEPGRYFYTNLSYKF